MQSSTFSLAPVEIDGRRYVTELHTDITGTVHRREYLAPIGADYNAIMLARAAQIDAQLAEAEADALVTNG